MKMKHIIIEGFCDEKSNTTMCPCKETFELGIHCIGCPNFSYTHCPNEIAISNEKGIVEDFIGFGGEMEPMEKERTNEYIALWKTISKDKINEAYDKFMKKICSSK